MSNFISQGLSWFQQQRESHCTHEILIGYSVATAAPINATVTSDDGQSTQNRVTLQKQIFHFVVRRCDLERHNIKLHRGLKIWYLNDVYELSYESKDIYEYNDPDRLDIVLKTVLISDNEGLSPTYRPTA